MIQPREYRRMKQISKWPKELNEYVLAFHARHGVWPNRMLASSVTYTRMDMVVGHKTMGLITDNYRIKFRMDPGMSERCLWLYCSSSELVTEKPV
jgi:hypothetical protein